MAEPSLFAFDVDGTLLDRGLAILPSTRAAVRALRARGHHVALASARPPRSVAALSHDLLGQVAEIIALNGAFVARDREVLLERALAPAAAGALLRRARRSGLDVNLLAGWEWLVEARTPSIDAEAAIVAFAPTLVADLEAHLDGVHKVLLLGPPARVRALRDAVAAGPELEASLSKPTYCEVVARGTSKAGAVAFLADRLGVPGSRVVAFGDGENDLPMITGAGLGVAMGNAVEAVKQAARFVTRDCDDDGIAHALHTLGFLD